METTQQAYKILLESEIVMKMLTLKCDNLTWNDPLTKLYQSQTKHIDEIMKSYFILWVAFIIFI